MLPERVSIGKIQVWKVWKVWEVWKILRLEGLILLGEIDFFPLKRRGRRFPARKNIFKIFSPNRVTGEEIQDVTESNSANVDSSINILVRRTVTMKLVSPTTR